MFVIGMPIHFRSHAVAPVHLSCGHGLFFSANSATANQILDLALRKQSRANSKYRTSLSVCLETYLPDLAQQFNFKEIKKETVRRFAPELGGDAELWGKRPMDHGLLQYATFDVVFLRVLAATIQAQLEPLYNNHAWQYSALNVAALRDLADHQITKENSSAAAPAGF